MKRRRTTAPVEARVADALELLRGNRMRLCLVVSSLADLRRAEDVLATSTVPEARRLTLRCEPWAAGEDAQ